MITQRKHYDREFKLEALHLWQTTDKSAREVEEDLGTRSASGLLYKWNKKFKAEGDAAFPGNGHVSEAEAEIRGLKHELEIAKQERDTALP